MGFTAKAPAPAIQFVAVDLQGSILKREKNPQDLLVIKKVEPKCIKSCVCLFKILLKFSKQNTFGIHLSLTFFKYSQSSIFTLQYVCIYVMMHRVCELEKVLQLTLEVFFACLSPLLHALQKWHLLMIYGGSSQRYATSNSWSAFLSAAPLSPRKMEAIRGYQIFEPQKIHLPIKHIFFQIDDITWYICIRNRYCYHGRNILFCQCAGFQDGPAWRPNHWQKISNAAIAFLQHWDYCTKKRYLVPSFVPFLKNGCP